MNLTAIIFTTLLLLTALPLASRTDQPTSQPWSPPAISLKSPLNHPLIAATPDELTRLRDAWKSTGPAHNILAERFALADSAIKSGIQFPPEGGQHNQWYQCDKCQLALKTLDPTHHQCPKCKTIYSGFPYDNVLYSKIHTNNIACAQDAAWAFAVTGEKKYADLAATVLLGYADRYLAYPMLVNSVNDKSIDVAALKLTKYKSAGHIDNQTLGEAMLMVPLAITYDLIYDSGSLSEDQKKQIETKLLRPMADCIDINKMGKVNWQTWHNAARLYAGAVLADEPMVKQSLLDPQNGFTFQMQNCVSPEGMWYENSWGYHQYTLMAMTHIAEGARHLGIDLYSHPSLKKMYLIPFDYQMSDGSLPRFGDSVQSFPANAKVNEFACAVYQDPRLRASLPDKPTWDSIFLGRDVSQATPPIPPTGSLLIPGAGHAILRTDGPLKLSAALTFSPFGGFHGHFDKLSFVFFAENQELALDPGHAASQAYRLPIHKEWYRSTTGHNAVLVDGMRQEGADGKLIAFNANNSYAAVAANAGPAFPNIDHARLLILTPTYLLIIDQLTATDAKPHTFDLLYHSIGTAIDCPLPETHEKLTGAPGYTYLADIKSYTPTADPLRATITTNKLQSHILLLTQPDDHFFTATGPHKSIDDRAPMLILRRTAQSATFITVIEPTQSTAAPAIQTISLPADGNGMSRTLRLLIHQTNQTDELLAKGPLGADLKLTTQSPGSPPKELISLKK